MTPHFDEIEKCLTLGDPAVPDVIENVVIPIYTSQLTRKAKRDT